MIDNDEIEKLRNMVGEGETLKVLHELKSKLVNSEFHNEIILLLNSINKIHRERRRNLITLQEEMLVENTLTFSLLEVLKELEFHHMNIKNSEPKHNLKSQVPDIKKTSNNKINSSKKPVFEDTFNRNINVLILGSEGVGKSTLVNSVFGKEIAKVSHMVITTLSVELYNLQLGSSDKPVNVQFIDTPGLDTQNINKIGDNKLIFDVIKSKVQEIDILLFVKPIDMRIDFKEGHLKLISEELGKDIWNRTIFIFSKSDLRFNSGTFEFYHFMNSITKSIQNDILGYIDCKDTLDLSFLPIYFQENVVNEVDWTGRLWSEMKRILNKRR
jgi:small GTP-binding protein